MIGQALVPYYRQILPVLNIFIRRNANMGDSIDYGQQKRVNLGELNRGGSSGSNGLSGSSQSSSTKCRG